MHKKMRNEVRVMRLLNQQAHRSFGLEDEEGAQELGG